MPNRVGILRLLEIEKDRTRRTGKTTVVALADLDYFKHINDTFGHPVGDEALRHFASAITSAIRPYDHVGRWGGEEFLLVLSDVPLPGAKKRLADIHASISNLHIQIGESQIVLNCSCWRHHLRLGSRARYQRGFALFGRRGPLRRQVRGA